MSRPIDAVLFDFGGVFTHSPFAVIEQLGEEMGTRPGQLQEIVFGPYHQDTDHPWHRLERGEIKLVDARDEVMALGRQAGLEVDPFLLLARTTTGHGVREEFVDCAHALRKSGIRTAMVTNNVAEFRQAWQRMIPVETMFDVLIDSSELGIRKPSPAIYERALTDLGNIAPHKAIFLDDYPANIEAANALGLHGILVEPDSQKSLSQVAALLATTET